MKRILPILLAFTAVQIVSAVWWISPVAAACDAKALANSSTVSFSPGTISLTNSSTVSITAEKNLLISCASELEGANVVLQYDLAGANFKNTTKTSPLIGSSGNITQSVTWDMLRGKKDFPKSGDVIVTVTAAITKSDGGKFLTKTFTPTLKISKDAENNKNVDNSKKSEKGYYSPVDLGGSDCEGLKNLIKHYGGGRASSLPAYCDIGTVYDKISNLLYYFVGIIAVLAVMYGGFLYMTARENDSQKKKGKDVLLYAILGLTIALMAIVIINIVINFVVDNRVS